MTTLGKILVFVNLLFSLLTGALIIMVFVTRTNWHAGYKEVERQLAGERARFSVMEQNIKDLEKEKGLEIAKIETDLKGAKTRAENAEKQLGAADEKVLEAEKRVAELEARNKQVTSAMESMKVEIKTLDERLAAEQKRVMELGLDNKKYKAEAIKATTDLQTAIDRSNSLLAKLVEADKKIRWYEGEAAAKTGMQAKNPPPEDIRGRVTATDDASGFVTINLGSDNGVGKGNTLEVFRLQPRPTYVGTLRVYEVRPHEAVGKLMGTGPRGRILKDDEVASRILGGGQ